MALSQQVNLTPPTRPAGGLLQAARPLPAGWGRGITFSTTQCVPPATVGQCPSGPELKPTHRPSGPHVFSSYTVVAALECTTLGVEYSPRVQAAETLDPIREYAVARELLTGEVTERDAGPGTLGNPALSTDVTHEVSAGDLATAIACLDQAAADLLYGRQAFLHLSPALAVHAAADDLIRRDGARWLTANGTLVVVSPGYDGREPVGSAAGNLWAYITGEVWAATDVGGRDVVSAVNRGDNTEDARAEEQALAVFDPCFVAAADTGIPACVVNEPTSP